MSIIAALVIGAAVLAYYVPDIKQKLRAPLTANRTVSTASSLEVDRIMTNCMNDAIASHDGSHAAAFSETDSLAQCANSRLISRGKWTCDSQGCWQDGKGFGWIRILSAIENPTTQLPANESGEEDYVGWCQQELGLGEDWCRSTWQNAG